MSNSFWNYTVQLVANTLAKAEDVAASLSGIQTGFNAVESDTLKSIKVTDGTAVVDINLNAAARSLKILTFNADGDVVAVDDMGNWQGNAAVAAGTAYNERDLVKDSTGSIGLNNIYRANTSFTNTGPMAGDAANWDLVVDVAEVTSAAADAASSAAAALVSENAAAATYILFTGQYYGSRTTAQQTNLDPNGAASTAGDIYFNSTLGRFKVFNGSTWIDALQTTQVTNTKKVDIGTWDMVASSNKQVAHGLDIAKIQGVRATIRGDDDLVSDFVYDFGSAFVSTQTGNHYIHTGATLVTLQRGAGGIFDNASYDNMGGDGNRGYILIDYID